MRTWFVYIVKCKDSSYYTGITTDLNRRMLEHNSKIGAKSVRGKLPVKLAYFEQKSDQKEAAKREREIKGWNHTKKSNLVVGNSHKGVYPEE